MPEQGYQHAVTAVAVLGDAYRKRCFPAGHVVVARPPGRRVHGAHPAEMQATAVQVPAALHSSNHSDWIRSSDLIEPVQGFRSNTAKRRATPLLFSAPLASEAPVNAPNSEGSCRLRHLDDLLPHQHVQTMQKLALPHPRISTILGATGERCVHAFHIARR